MDRRTFIKNSTLASATLAVRPDLKKPEFVASRPAGKLLNAYYFRAHMYTIVPKQVREDMRWMADKGTNVVTVAILEQDLNSAVENVQIICEEANKAGMSLFVVPSRWGGMFAGAPKVPSLFSVLNPQTWVLKKDGKPQTNGISGVISSIHYPETFEFFRTSVDKMMKLWNVKGIIWDEPKSFIADYSAKAIEKLGPDAPLQDHVRAVIGFYSRLNQSIKEKYPDLLTSMFAYANFEDMVVEEAAKTGFLDYFGCDGRPWRNEDGGKQEGEGKVLLGAGERFLSAAQRNRKKSLWLIENHNMDDRDLVLMEKRFPEILSKQIDQLIYYYYPRNIQNPDRAMKIVGKYVKQFK